MENLQVKLKIKAHNVMVMSEILIMLYCVLNVASQEIDSISMKIKKIVLISIHNLSTFQKEKKLPFMTTVTSKAKILKLEVIKNV